MTNIAKQLVVGSPLIKEFRVLSAEDLLKLNMNLFHSVGKGATIQPRGVFIKYIGDESRPDEIDFGIVGKGITYDTGGLNIKLQLIE